MAIASPLTRKTPDEYGVNCCTNVIGRHSLGPCVYGQDIHLACPSRQESFATKRPRVQLALALGKRRLSLGYRLLLCLGLEAKELTLTGLLNDGKRDEELTLWKVGHAPSRMGKNEARQQYERVGNHCGADLQSWPSRTTRQ